SSFISDVNDVDMFAVRLQAGDEVAVTTKAPTLDTALRVFDGAGRQLAFNDDRENTNAGLTFDAPADGVYYVGLSGFMNFSYDPAVAGTGSGGTSSGSYTLELTRVLARRAESESGPEVTGLNDSPQTADAIPGTTHLQGAIGTNDVDYYRLTLT